MLTRSLIKKTITQQYFTGFSFIDRSTGKHASLYIRPVYNLFITFSLTQAENLNLNTPY